MAKLIVKTGSTSRLEHVFILDSASTTGAGKTALTNASVTMHYFRPGDSAPTSVTLSAGTLATWASGGFVKVQDTDMPGVYEVGIPNAVFAAGANHAIVMIKGTGIAPVVLEYQLVAFDPDSGSNLGLAALPTATTGTAGAIITSGSGTAQLTTTSGVVTANTTQWGGTAVTGMPMPTYTQPTGFLAATFPGTIASTTNITAATGITLAAVTHTGAVIPTVTTVSNRVSANTDQWGGTAVTGMPLPTASYTTPPTVAAISTQVWTEPIPGTFAAGTAGAKLNSASSAGDPWSTVVPGSYAAGTAGFILGTNLNATISSRMATFTYTAPLTTTETAQAVWNALLASYTTTNSFGARVVRTLSSSTTNEVTIGASNHIAANVHAMQSDVITAAAIAADATAEIADRVLGRTISGGADGGRTVTSALRILRNKFTAASTTLTVYAEDDVTTAWTSTLSTDAAATPITGSDPA